MKREFTFEQEMSLLNKGEYEKSRYIMDIRSIEFYNGLVEDNVHNIMFNLEHMDIIQDLIKNPYTGMADKAYWSQRWLSMSDSSMRSLDTIMRYIDIIRETKKSMAR